jgi:hypothetical protein
MKEKYKHVLITNCSIGHSGLSNTTCQQILDSVAEFYILSNSTEKDISVLQTNEIAKIRYDHYQKKRY